MGAMGAPGAQGTAGTPGADGLAGPKGDPGTPGAIGPAGPQGLQGPGGTVLVLDGGVVVGPPGSSVAVTPITAGGAICPYGGVRVTQLSDGGITNVCNGASPVITTTPLPVMSPQCATGWRADQPP